MQNTNNDPFSAAISFNPNGIFNRMRILIVDDEPFNCFALQSLMTSLKLSNLENVVDYVYSGQDYIKFVQDSIVEIYDNS